VQYYRDFFEIFKSFIVRDHDHSEITYCVETLGFMCFICGDIENSYDCCIFLIELIKNHTSNNILSTAVMQLTLIYTTFSDEEVISFIEGDPSFETIANLAISNANYETKYAVGEMFALFCAISKREQQESYHTSYFDSFVDIQNIIDNLTSLKSKKTRDRLDIRDILNTIYEGIEPEISITIRNEKFSISSWHYHL